MSKDKIIGAVVILLGIAIAIIYTLGSVVDLLVWSYGAPGNTGFDITSWLVSGIADRFDLFNWRYFVVVPMWLVVILVAIIAIWIGYSMLTTPAPVPLEELEEELAAEEEELKDEEDED